MIMNLSVMLSQSFKTCLNNQHTHTQTFLRYSESLVAKFVSSNAPNRMLVYKFS